MNPEISYFVEFVIRSPLFYIWVLVLQILLCTRKRIVLGIILPSIFFIHSLVVSFYFVSFQYFGTRNATSNGFIISLFLFSFIPGIILLSVFTISLILFRKRSITKRSKNGDIGNAK